MSQFECPRCQTQFSGESGSSFEDCPECGSLALPFGDGGPAPAIQKAPTPEQLAQLTGASEQVSIPDGPALSEENSAEGAQSGSGILNALLEDTPMDMDLPGVHLPTDTPSSISFGGQVPNTLLGGEFGALAGADVPAEPPSPFVPDEVSGLHRAEDSSKTRNEEWDALSFDNERQPSSGDVFDEATIDQQAASLNQTFEASSGGLPTAHDAAGPFSESVGLDLPADFLPADFLPADFLPGLEPQISSEEQEMPLLAGLLEPDDEHVSSTSTESTKSEEAPQVPEEPSLEEPSLEEPHQDISEPSVEAAPPHSAEEHSTEQYAEDETAFGDDHAAFFSQEASDENQARLFSGEAASSDSGGVLLKDLEGDPNDFRLDGVDASDLFSGANFDALEAAFDEAAGDPEDVSMPTAENALLQSSELLFPSVDDEGLSGMEMGLPHAPKLRPAEKELHLSLRPETLELTTYPRDEEGDDAADDDGHDVGIDGLRSLSMDGDSLRGLRGVEAERTEVVPRKRTTSNSDDEKTTNKGSQKTALKANDGYELSDVPSVFGALSVMRVLFLGGLGLLLGVGAGVLSAPKETKKPTSARTRAEQKIASGNKAYDESRFDDALGKFRGAISSDRQYALAYRAKGSALAKEKRFKDAARAYRRYLEVAVDPADKEEVEEILVRFLGPGWKKK
ncbi:MAG: tetratricopeptide repeat protein [Deltaproteobacteria bacterium]|nr:tetratricopeptide repeat protein [Deltaproteobacteria bacterium]